MRFSLLKTIDVKFLDISYTLSTVNKLQTKPFASIISNIHVFIYSVDEFLLCIN